MRTHAQLCHVSSERCVVLVEAFEGATPLGSALGEARTVTEAEDQALARLRARLSSAQSDSARGISSEMDAEAGGKTSVPLVATELTVSSSASADLKQRMPIRREPLHEDTSPKAKEALNLDSLPEPPSEAPTDPEDWSEELIAIDLNSWFQQIISATVLNEQPPQPIFTDTLS